MDVRCLSNFINTVNLNQPNELKKFMPEHAGVNKMVKQDATKKPMYHKLKNKNKIIHLK